MVNEITYKKSGVDIEAGDKLVERIIPLARKTFSKQVIQDIGSFGSLFQIDLTKYPQPVLVSGTDGVGTKLKIAFLTGKHDTVGIDLVAMCVNDILTLGADPAFFLDYFATGKLDLKTGEEVIKGVAEGCRRAKCSLVGGETAEMPGFYEAGEYDLAGFAVGIVNRDNIVDGKKITDGDAIIGLASSGIHSNGYSLARNVLFNIAHYSADTYREEVGRTLGEELLEPTVIYAEAVQRVKAEIVIKAMAHITGGGIPGNLLRSVPEGYSAVIHEKTWKKPVIFDLIQKIGNVPDQDMKSTFNMGIGYAIIVSEKDAQKAIDTLRKHQHTCYRIGIIKKGGEGVQYA